MLQVIVKPQMTLKSHPSYGAALNTLYGAGKMQL